MRSTETNKHAPFQCLVVEDDVAFSSMVAGVVRDTGGEPLICHSLAAAREAVAQKAFDLVLLDNHLPDGKGYDFHAQVSRRYPDAPIVMITGLPDLGEAITLTRNGLFDYLTKPVSIEALEDCLRRARLRLVQNTPSNDAVAWVGNSTAMHEVMQQLRQAGRHREATVLLTGETGTGKDLMARVLHQFTFGDTKAPFIGLNCAAIPSEMFEAELFGAERGAYTGAEKRRQGLAAAAQGGTLFLDEIGEVSLALQSKLLRLLEAREFRPLGSTEVQSFNGRFVAATNKSLDDEVKAGRFREDLLYRLNVLTIEVPPLRKRSEDIPGLAELLLKQISEKYGRTKPMLKPDELAALQSHAFPGNVRELRNILERSLLKTPEDSRWLQLDGHWKGSPTVPQPASKPAAPLPVNLSSNRDLSPLEEQEYRMIEEALREAKGGIRRAAAKLGLSPQSLLRRLEKWPELRNSAGV